MHTTSAPGRPLAVWGGLTVPYVTAWSGERDVSPAGLVIADGRLRYQVEGPEDRDRRGGLWERWTGDYGDGAPCWGKVAPERHRTAMEHLLCQICAHPASRTKLGYLFLARVRATVGELERRIIGEPPLCLGCAVTAREQCPQLRRAYTAMRVRKCAPWGMGGTAYVPRPGHQSDPRPVVADATVQLAYGHPTLRYVLGKQLLRELRRVTIVDLDKEVAGLAI
ncbi:hypothetical protein DMH15_29555 [Streptomyces sp. WAC 06725]|uniref:hypothetical protein n=1 Tax=Streptomyces sp. WAC 06725 TaxID=2203209 RepID=UPI000F736592|nr:hypothetical protein [Streptomyces sp. WAC 06725]RSO26421.1 hypothetical protein DMH15_29555 [Streptomyces sp. WAC 06725]